MENLTRAHETTLTHESQIDGRMQAPWRKYKRLTEKQSSWVVRAWIALDLTLKKIKLFYQIALFQTWEKNNFHEWQRYDRDYHWR